MYGFGCSNCWCVVAYGENVVAVDDGQGVKKPDPEA
jgi:hypothetical protein